MVMNAPSSVQYIRAVLPVFVLIAIPRVVSICPSQCRCNMTLQMVECNRGRLEHFPIQLNPRVRSIQLDHNRISDLHGSFDYYPHLHTLSLRHNRLQELAARTFEHQRQLQRLDLSGNNIATISVVAFNGLEQLIKLDLSANNLRHLPAALLAPLTHLQHLNLAGNKLKRIADSDMASVGSRLISLDLSTNEFNVSPDLSQLTVLRQLLMSNNYLKTMPHIPHSVEVMDVSNNSIVKLGPFKTASNMQNLNVSSNGLEAVPNWLYRLPKLRRLDISGNRIEVLKIEHAGVLEELYCSDQPLLRRILTKNTGLLPKLRVIYICNNKNLTQISQHIFDSPNLEIITLNGNSLDKPPTVFNLSMLTYLSVRDNQFRCDCSMLSLRSWIKKGKISDIRCAGPDNLKGQYLSHLNSSLLGCSAHYMLLVMLITVPMLFIMTILLTFFALCRRSKTANSSPDALADLAVGSCKEAFSNPPLYLLPLTSEWNLVRPTATQQRTSLAQESHDNTRVLSLYSSNSSPYLFDDSEPKNSELSVITLSSNNRKDDHTAYCASECGVLGGRNNRLRDSGSSYDASTTETQQCSLDCRQRYHSHTGPRGCSARHIHSGNTLWSSQESLYARPTAPPAATSRTHRRTPCVLDELKCTRKASTQASRRTIRMKQALPDVCHRRQHGRVTSFALDKGSGARARTPHQTLLSTAREGWCSRPRSAALYRQLAFSLQPSSSP